jgi:hypothetical protein
VHYSQLRIVAEQVVAYKLPVTALRLALDAQQGNPLIPHPGPQLIERGLGLRRVKQCSEPCPAVGITLPERLPVVPGISERGQMQVLDASCRKCASELPFGQAWLPRQGRQPHIHEHVYTRFGQRDDKILCATPFISDGDQSHLLKGPHRAIMHCHPPGGPCGFVPVLDVATLATCRALAQSKRFRFGRRLNPKNSRIRNFVSVAGYGAHLSSWGFWR